MPIEFACPSCGKTLRVPDDSSGRQARCPACSAVATVPGAAPGAGVPPVPPLPPPPSTNPFSEGNRGGPPSNPFAPAGGGVAGPVNPYAAPAPPKEGEGASAYHGELQHAHVEFTPTLTKTWEMVAARLGECALAGLALVGLSMGMGLVGQVVNIAAQASREPAVIVVVSLMWQVVAQVVQVCLQLGIMNFGLKMARTGRASAADLFSIGPYVLRGLGVTLIILLITLGLILVTAIPAAAVFVAQGGPKGFEKDPGPVFLALIPTLLIGVPLLIWISLRWMLALEFIIDRNAGVFAALSRSAEFMRGNKLRVFSIQIVVSFLSMFVVLCTCCVGAVVVTPYMGVLSAVIYFSATGQPFGAWLPTAAAAPRKV